MMKTNRSAWSILLLLLMSITGSQAQVLTSIAQTGTYFANPIISTDAPDPTIIQANGYYYLYGTAGRINIWRSRNLTTWTKVGSAFEDATRPTFVKGVNSYWAPDINKIGDQYVLYYAMSKWGGGDSCGIGVAVASTPVGPFKCVKDQGKLFTSYEIGVNNSIDPFYIEDNGKKYLFWGSFTGIFAIELSDDGLSIKEGATKVQIGGTAYEGTYIYKRGDYYYFFGSIGSCCEGANSTYKTVYARSKNLLGPYVSRSNGKLLENKHDILIQGNAYWAGTGHNAEFIEDKNGDTWIPYHAYDISNTNAGRMVLLDRINWSTSGWPSVINSEPSTQSGRPAL